jgi:hypothetical protein
MNLKLSFEMDFNNKLSILLVEDTELNQKLQ